METTCQCRRGCRRPTNPNPEDSGPAPDCSRTLPPLWETAGRASAGTTAGPPLPSVESRLHSLPMRDVPPSLCIISCLDTKKGRSASAGPKPLARVAPGLRRACATLWLPASPAPHRESIMGDGARLGCERRLFSMTAFRPSRATVPACSGVPRGCFWCASRFLSIASRRGVGERRAVKWTLA